MRHVLIVGATSDIAQALSQKLGALGNNRLYLAGRDESYLSRIARDLEVRHRTCVSIHPLDIRNVGQHREFFESLKPLPDTVIFAVGYLGNQEEAQRNWHEASEILEVNFQAIVSLAEIVAAKFEERGAGSIIAISSVAGNRGRKSNYTYGAAKAGLSAYLSGLRNRLHRSGVLVMTVLPGFVRSKMTHGLEFPALLVASPDQVAKDILQAWNKRVNILYSPWYWRWIMLAIRAIPEPLFKRLDL